MFARVLLDPTAEGGGAPAPTPTPTDNDPIKAILAEKVAEARAYKEQLDAIGRTQAERDAEAERQRLKLVADKEGAEKALEEQRTAWEKRAAEAERKAQESADRHLKAEKNRAIALGLAGKPWLEGCAEAAEKLLADHFETRFAPDGSIQFVEKATGLPGGPAMEAMLAKPPFINFLAPSSRGGSGATNPPPPGQGQQAQQLGSNPFEAALAQGWLERNKPSGPIPMLGGRFTPN